MKNTLIICFDLRLLRLLTSSGGDNWYLFIGYIYIYHTEHLTLESDKQYHEVEICSIII
jgi:hypothetical protein